jgi:hypothetical protein
LSGAIIGRGLGLISSVVVARILGKTGFGELGIIQSTIGMFGTFAGFGLGMTATKFMGEYRTADPIRAGRVRGLSSSFAWITSGLASTILFFAAPWLAKTTLAAPHLAGLLRISSIFLFLTSVNGAQTGVLSGLEAFKTVARISLWSGLANFPLMVAGVYLWGITGAVLGMTVATALNWFLNHIAIRRECAGGGIPYSYTGCWKEKRVGEYHHIFRQGFVLPDGDAENVSRSDGILGIDGCNCRRGSSCLGGHTLFMPGGRLLSDSQRKAGDYHQQ